MDDAEKFGRSHGEAGAALAQVLTGFLHVLADARSSDYFVQKVANNSFLLTRWRELAEQLRALAWRLMAAGHPFPSHLLERLNLLLGNAVLTEPIKMRCDTPRRRNGMAAELKDLAKWFEANVTEVPAAFQDEGGDNADDDAGVDSDAGVGSDGSW